MATKEIETYYITKDQMKNVTTYIPLIAKMQWVELVSQKCLNRVEVNASYADQQIDLPKGFGGGHRLVNQIVGIGDMIDPHPFGRRLFKCKGKLLYKLGGTAIGLALDQWAHQNRIFPRSVKLAHRHTDAVQIGQGAHNAVGLVKIFGFPHAHPEKRRSGRADHNLIRIFHREHSGSGF